MPHKNSTLEAKVNNYCQRFLSILLLMACAIPLQYASAAAPESDGSELLAVSTGGNPVGSAYPESISQKACLECHANPELKSVTKRGAGLQLTVSDHHYDRSVHGNMECVTCHAPEATAEDFADTPHNLTPEALPSCMNCHSESFDYVKHQLAESVHFAKQGADIGCTDCHNPHTERSVTAMDSYSASVAEANKVCMDCHTSAVKYHELTGNAVYSQDLSHEFLPNRDEHFASVKCIECHTPATDEQHQHQILAKDQALRECEACHTEDNSLIVSRIQHYTDDPQGGGAFLDKGLFDDAEMLAKMKQAGIGQVDVTPIVKRVVSQPEVMEQFADDYLPGVGQTKALDHGIAMFLGLALAIVLIHGGLRLFLAEKAEGEDKPGEKIYPTAVRVLHSTNAILFLILLATGWGIHAPDAALSLPMEFSSEVHTVAGLLLLVNFALFMLYSLLSGDIMQYIPFRQGGMQAFWSQMHYYLIGIFRGADKPHHASAKQRLNPIQQLTYLLVYCLGMFVLLASGIVLLFPEVADAMLPGLTARTLATLHYLLAAAYLAFVIMHLYMITTGKRPLSLLKGMLTGRHYD